MGHSHCCSGKTTNCTQYSFTWKCVRDLLVQAHQAGYNCFLENVASFIFSMELRSTPHSVHCVYPYCMVCVVERYGMQNLDHCKKFIVLYHLQGGVAGLRSITVFAQKPPFFIKDSRQSILTQNAAFIICNLIQKGISLQILTQ